MQDDNLFSKSHPWETYEIYKSFFEIPKFQQDFSRHEAQSRLLNKF